MIMLACVWRYGNAWFLCPRFFLPEGDFYLIFFAAWATRHNFFNLKRLQNVWAHCTFNEWRAPNFCTHPRTHNSCSLRGTLESEDCRTDTVAFPLRSRTALRVCSLVLCWHRNKVNKQTWTLPYCSSPQCWLFVQRCVWCRERLKGGRKGYRVALRL